MNRKPITVVVPSLGIGGSTRSGIRLAVGIAERGNPVDLVSLRNLDHLKNEVPESIRLIRFGSHRVRWSLLSLVRYLKQEQPQALIAISTVANLMSLFAIRLAQTSTPLLITEHNQLSRKAGSGVGSMGKFVPQLVRLMYPSADAVAAVSSGVADDIARITSIDRKQIRVVYNPTFSSDNERLAQMPLNDDWFAAESPPVILGVGRLNPQKDFKTLLRAFRELRCHCRARLVIMGEGPDRGNLEHLIAELGLSEDVRLPGFDPNPFRYMSRARMFVLSSRWEGLPGVLIQAMSVGCPVISTDCPSGAGEILENGALGRLVPVGDVDALADAMAEELMAPQPVEGLRQRAMDFSLENSVDGHLSLLYPEHFESTLAFPESNAVNSTERDVIRVSA